jgi:hypothetical protein
MAFVLLSMVERGAYDEDLGTEVETSKPVAINVAAVRCFYKRTGGKPGTRLTFTDGGGFAVAETVDVVAQMITGGEVTMPAPVAPLALVPPAAV